MEAERTGGLAGAQRPASVGVVIPAWNAERFIREAIESAIAQTHRPSDIVVVDDGSSDATAVIARTFGPPVRVISQPRGGTGAARNRGAAAVQGSWIAFLDADDRLTRRGVALRLAAAAENPGTELVFGAERRFTETRAGRPIGTGVLQPSPLPCAMLVRRDAFERVGPFSLELFSDNIDWLLRAREEGLAELMLVSQVLWRRVHGANQSVKHRGEIGMYAHAIKRSLDRRRAT
jgi:glycosyltransferase involved in cell wall biosynthesis